MNSTYILLVLSVCWMAYSFRQVFLALKQARQLKKDLKKIREHLVESFIKIRQMEDDLNIPHDQRYWPEWKLN